MTPEQTLASLRQTAEELATQDNASTQNPIFVVKQRVVLDGIDPEFGDDIRWIVPDGEGLYTMDEALEALGIDVPASAQYEALLEAKAQETGIVYRWEYVSAHFTRGAAERYIERNAHRMTEPRVFVDSQYRCSEWNAVRSVLLAAQANPEALETFVRGILEP